MSSTCKVLSVASLLTGSLLAPSFARAQQEGFDKPLGQGQGLAMGQTTTRSVMTHNDNGNSMTVEMENGRVTSVQHNGKAVPKDRYRIEDGKLTVLDAEGKPVHEMRLPQVGGALAAPGMPSVPPVPLMGELFRQGPRVMISPDGAQPVMPRVRMGIMMAADNETNAVIVESVGEGSPAEKAGLRPGDVIERIDDKPVRSQQELREVLATKKPGDKAVLRIERENDTQELTVELASADDVGNRFGASALPMRSMVMLDAGELEKLYSNAESELAKALDDLSKDNNPQNAKKALEHALASLRASRDEMKKLRDETASNGLDLGGIEAWGERFGQQMGGWGQDFGQQMERWGEQMRQWAEQMEREGWRAGEGRREQAPDFRRELRPARPEANNQNAQNPDAETRELREMLRAMQDRLDRLEQQKPEGEPR
jgi:hypothetical protein